MAVLRTFDAAAVVGAVRRTATTGIAAVGAIRSFADAAAVIFRSAWTFALSVVRIAVLAAAAVDPVTAINLFTYVFA